MAHTATPTDTAARLQTERQAIETLYRAFGDKNPDLLDRVCTADWQDIPLLPGQEPGPAGLKAIIRGFIEAFPDIRIILHDIIQEPGRAGVRAEIRGTHRGEFMGMAATGKKVAFAIHEFHELNGERLTATWHLEDWFSVFRQLGTYPPM